MAGESTEEIWTVVVGCTSADIRMHNLRLYRFRVDAASGRVLGRSGDLLHRLRHVAPADDEAELFPDARAALISRDDDQRRLYLFCDRWRLNPGSGWDSGQVATPVSKPTVAMALDLADKTLPTIFALDLPPSSCALSWPVPAAGNIWAPYVAPIPGGRRRSRLTMLHLDETSDDDSHQWIDAGSIDLPQEDSSSSTMSASGYYSSIYGGYAISGKTPLLQGYAVLGDVILVSLRTCDFYLFRCSTCHWSRVYIVGDCCHYIPLNGRAVFSEEDDHIYFFRDSCLYAYKFSLEEGKMIPPIKLASLYDDYNAHGNGFLAGLSNRVLCVAWIGMDLTCGCTTRHLLATTLRVIGSRDDHGEFVPTSTQVLHSTWRNVDMLSTEAQDHGSFDRFCFLQEFGEDDLWLEEDANDAVDSSSQVSLPCCRTFPKGSLEKRKKYTSRLISGSIDRSRSRPYDLLQKTSI